VRDPLAHRGHLDLGERRRRLRHKRGQLVVGKRSGHAEMLPPRSESGREADHGSAVKSPASAVPQSRNPETWPEPYAMRTDPRRTAKSRRRQNWTIGVSNRFLTLASRPEPSRRYASYGPIETSRRPHYP
jgi:hypothetical protein